MTDKFTEPKTFPHICRTLSGNAVKLWNKDPIDKLFIGEERDDGDARTSRLQWYHGHALKDAPVCKSTFMNIDAVQNFVGIYSSRKFADDGAFDDRIAVFRRDYEDGVLIGFHVEKVIS
jgi:hypothetical protein